MHSARLEIKEHMTSVGEEILCVLNSVELNVRVFVLERLSAAAEFMCSLFQREIETLHNTKLHTADVVEPQKRARGRPRKYPVCQPSPAVQRAVIQPKKRKPGRPRKHKCGGPVSSPLPEEESPLPEEEREGRDEEREVEMAGEDEERIGRRYDGDPTWHPDVVEPQKRARGRPRKYPVCQPSPAVQRVVIQPKKRKPGRPRKHKCGGPVPSPLPEEEREGRGEEREDEMAGEDEERIGRRYGGDPTWHPDVVEPQKRGRGRPRKYPSPAVRCAPVIQHKKPGRPRKHKCGGPVPSPLPEEEREGRGEERDDEMAGEDEERIGRRFHKAQAKHLPVCKEESEQRVRSQEESAPPLSKEEQEELLQRPEEADAEDCGTSQSTADDQLSSRCSESDSEAIDEDWEETSEGHLALNTLKSQKTHNVEGQRLSLSKKLCQDLNSQKQTHSMWSHTGGKKTFTCEVCGKEFGLKCSLQIHMRVHTGEKPFTCTVCGKGFSTKCVLQVHMRMHTGEKPFTCTVCGKSCNHMSHLKTHMTMHSEKRPYICEVCGKGFKVIGSLKTHLKSHTGEKPFSCTVCCKGFSQKVNLQVHMRTHTGEKPYNCTVCGNGFRDKYYLKKHMRVHTGERPFTCTFCARQFGKKWTLEKHTRRKHTGGKHF